MDPMAEIQAAFFVECAELLESLEEKLLLLQDGDEDPETVNSVFRAIHSIKGGAGAFGLDALVGFAHRFETVLDEVRSDRLVIDGPAISLFLQCADILADHVVAARDNTEVDDPKSEAALKQLEALMGDAPEEKTQGIVPAFTPMVLDLGLETPPAVEKKPCEYVFQCKAGLSESGNEPLFLFRNLATQHPMTCTLNTIELCNLKDMDPSISMLSWTLKFEDHVARSDIEDVLEFAQSLYELTPKEPVTAAQPELPSAPTQSAQKTPAIEKPPSDTSPRSTQASAPTVRVDLDRIDRLVNLVGELVINQAMLSQSLSDFNMTKSVSIASGLEEFQQLTRDIQDSVMAIRAQPVKPLFQRMSRIVREAAHDTGKKARLKVEGENTEVDKTVIERLADPLTHMIRNAVDHGLEMPEDRLSCGKSAEGEIILRACHRSGRIVIEVSDNGAGINRDKVRQIALSKGLIDPDEPLTDPDIDNILFMPGFSTATTVSSLSGRGVGMDVVKRSIQDLGGRITISSEPQKGTKLSISLPLTLAVLDGMVVEVSEQTMVIPLSSIVETLTLADAHIQELDDERKVVQIRGAFFPLLDLGKELGFEAVSSIKPDSVVLFILTEEGERYALIVDAIQEQRQVVIKGLNTSYGQVPGVAAATILGDGKIALILDTVDIFVRSKRQRSHKELRENA